MGQNCRYRWQEYIYNFLLSHGKCFTFSEITYVKVKGCQLECKLFDMPHINVINYILNSFCIFTLKIFCYNAILLRLVTPKHITFQISWERIRPLQYLNFVSFFFRHQIITSRISLVRKFSTAYNHKNQWYHRYIVKNY